MNNIIERKSGYDNEAMLKYCNSLKGILESSKSVTKGSGKNLRTEVIRKYPKDEPTMEVILRSIEYYSNTENQMDNEIEFRDYQIDIINRGKDLLKKNKFLYLAMEVRTGKTLTSLGIANNRADINNVLFVTKKKAISSIMKDYEMLDPTFFINVINYESLHTLDGAEVWDLVICDEAHSMGAFPKPSGRALAVSGIVRRCRCEVILLSGTPTPESYSQMYHQVYMIPNNPFSGYKNFYRFCDDYVDVKEKRINGLAIRDYSNGKDSILEKMKPYMITYTQKEAGFTSTIDEEILYVPMSTLTHSLTKKLQRDLVIEGKDETILADTSVKLMMKLHQLYSGTIKFESGNSKVLDLTKAEFIKERFTGNKIGIFYKFKAELEALKQVFGDDLTTELSVFEDTDKSIALQIVSGREGISLRMADFLVYYNIDFSATSYWQSRDRMTTKDRMHNKVYWVFTKDGIEDKIYQAVSKKKDYTVSHFKKDLFSL
jgi:hypothetical protein